MNPGQSVFLGIDGGATHSFGVVVDRDGNVLASARAGSLNFLGSSLADARRQLQHLITTLEKGGRARSDMVRAVIGCAALFAEATAAEHESLCRDILPLDRTRLVSDTATAYHGATLGGSGLLVIAGTGSMVLAGDEAGRFTHVGGWGHILGDEGGAWWIAREAIRAAIAGAEARGPATALTGWVCRWFRVATLPEVVPLVHDPGFTKHAFAGLARYLVENVGSDDGTLRDILIRAGRELAGQALAAIGPARLTQKPVPVFLVGSVLEQNALVRESFVTTMKEAAPIRIATPRLPPVLGAAVLAMRDAGVPPSPETVERLQSFKLPAA